MKTISSRFAAVTVAVLAGTIFFAIAPARADVVNLNSTVRSNGAVTFVHLGPGFGSSKTAGQNNAADIEAQASRVLPIGALEFHTINGGAAIKTDASTHMGPGIGSVKSAQTDRSAS